MPSERILSSSLRPAQRVDHAALVVVDIAVRDCAAHHDHKQARLLITAGA